MTGLGMPSPPTPLPEGEGSKYPKLRYIALDSWRGIAAICVVILHLPFYSHLLCVELFRNSFLFVDFFFVLSGFVITHSYYGALGRPGGLRIFIRKRVARLWPLHFATTLMFVFLFAIREALRQHLNAPAEDGVIGAGLGYFMTSLSINLLFAQDIWPLDYNDFNGPSWSISVEFFTYLLFGLVVRKLKAFHWLVWLLLSLLGAAVIAKLSTKFLENQDLGIFRCFYGFFLGCLAYRVKGFLTRGSTAMEVSAALLIYLVVSSTGFSAMNMISPWVFALVILVFSREEGRLAEVLKTRVFRTVGTLSYSIYLNHFFFVLLVRYGATFVERAMHQPIRVEVMAPTVGSVSAILIGDRWTMDLLTVLFLGLVVGFSFLTYKYIEIPWQTRINSIRIMR